MQVAYLYWDWGPCLHRRGRLSRVGSGAQRKSWLVCLAYALGSSVEFLSEKDCVWWEAQPEARVKGCLGLDVLDWLRASPLMALFEDWGTAKAIVYRYFCLAAYL